MAHAVTAGDAAFCVSRTDVPARCPWPGKPRRYLVLSLRSSAPVYACRSAMAVPMTATRAMAPMRWTVISMPSVAWMRPVVRWTVRVMMVVVPRPVCRTPVVVGAAIRLIDVGIAIPVAVSRACRVATRQKQDERRDSKQFFHARSLDVPTSLGFSMCKPGFLQSAAGISRSFLVTCSTTSATWRRCAGCIRGMQADGQMAA